MLTRADVGELDLGGEPGFSASGELVLGVGELVLNAATSGDAVRGILFGVEVAINGGNKSAVGRIDNDGGDVDLLEGDEWEAAGDDVVRNGDENGDADLFLSGDCSSSMAAVKEAPPFIKGGVWDIDGRFCFRLFTGDAVLLCEWRDSASSIEWRLSSICVFVTGSEDIGIRDKSGMVGSRLAWLVGSPEAETFSNFLLSRASSLRRFTSRPDPLLDVEPAGDLGLSGDPGLQLFLLVPEDKGSAASRFFIRSRGLSSI